MSSSTKRLEAWNRKFHFYLGLYFLFFLWLFSLSGLMLNHGQWRVSLAANGRTEQRYETSIQPPVGETEKDRATHVMRQLDLVGELDLPAQRPPELSFNTSRPSDSNQVRVDLVQNRAIVRHFTNNHLSRFRNLHTFSGSRYNQPASGRDWVVTRMWVFAMDALAAALMVMVFGSYYMWWRLKKRHGLGLAALLLGCLACAWFVAGVS
jgi:hypothetical protein